MNEFKESQRNVTQPNHSSPATFAAVIATVVHEIGDHTMIQHLINNNIEHRCCNRIETRATKKPTMFIRVITVCEKSFHKLMNEGVFLHHKHYLVYTSPPPPPSPSGKYAQFSHTTTNFPNKMTCQKYQGQHVTNVCTSDLSITCNSCGSTHHAAWSLKCPRRPTQPVAGVPNAPINSINKKSAELAKSIIKNNHIHAHITTHDYIINTYISKLNIPQVTNRQELIAELKQRFIEAFRIDTAVVFTGNRIYILMFNLDIP